MLPLREEMRQHNALTSAVSLLLGQVRKRACAEPCRGMPPAQHCPSGAMNAASACNWAMRSAPLWPQRSSTNRSRWPSRKMPWQRPPLLEHVDEAAIRQQLRSSLPVDSLLDWLHTHHGHLQDATLLRLFHELQHEQLADRSQRAS